MNGGEIIGRVLHAHGVRFLYTLCGGHISPILAAAKARGLRIVDVRDEATAVFAADASARLSGLPGIDQRLAADHEQRPLGIRELARGLANNTLCGRLRSNRRDVVGNADVRIGKQPPRMMRQVHAHDAIREGIAFRRRAVVPLADYRFVVQQVDRALDEDGPRDPALRNLESLRDSRCEVAHAFDRPTPLHMRLEQRELIDVLQRSAPLQQRRRRTAEHNHR